ncbi:hypothetical protein [Amaricoccus sp.]|uniref:hypothetical protein n=1 Tax=Amaricoccus sp. TaxID=1872485 RepID=UPI001B4994F6|nr:hypothetical protein [Amaricoccus sp.]MBP7002584.1 hypothetical protein [Amaricoccus sp.]
MSDPRLYYARFMLVQFPWIYIGVDFMDLGGFWLLEMVILFVFILIGGAVAYWVNGPIPAKRV